MSIRIGTSGVRDALSGEAGAGGSDRRRFRRRVVPSGVLFRDDSLDVDLAVRLHDDPGVEVRQGDLPDGDARRVVRRFHAVEVEAGERQELLTEGLVQGGEVVHGHLSPEPRAQRPVLRRIERNVPFRRDRPPRQEDLHLLREIRLHGSDREGFRPQPGVDRRRIDREGTAQGDASFPFIQGGEGESTGQFSADGDVLRLQPQPVEGDLHRRVRGAILEPCGVPVDDRFLDGDLPRLPTRPFPGGRFPRAAFRRGRLRGSRFLRKETGDVRLPDGGTADGHRSLRRGDLSDHDLFLSGVDLPLFHIEPGDGEEHLLLLPLTQAKVRNGQPQTGETKLRTVLPLGISVAGSRVEGPAVDIEPHGVAVVRGVFLQDHLRERDRSFRSERGEGEVPFQIYGLPRFGRKGDPGDGLLPRLGAKAVHVDPEIPQFRSEWHPPGSVGEPHFPPGEPDGIDGDFLFLSARLFFYRSRFFLFLYLTSLIFFRN